MAPKASKVTKRGARRSKMVSPKPWETRVFTSYHDVTLTEADYASIVGGWLTDNAITWWQEYMEREQLHAAYPRAEVVLVRPAVAFLISHEDGEKELRGMAGDFEKATHLFMPVNNNADVWDAEGGTHWSLLVVSLAEPCAFHYDSAGSGNVHNAEVTVRRLETILGRSLGSIEFVDMPGVPQQNNTEDCGVYVCCIMQYLLFERLLCASLKERISMRIDDAEVDADRWRTTSSRFMRRWRRKEECLELELQNARDGAPAAKTD